MIQIRNEEEKDYEKVEEITREAFWNLYVPGCKEHYLVHVMRQHKDFLPELALVIEVDHQLVGNIMYTKAKLIDDFGKEKAILTFGPVCILPEYQRKGYGKQLMEYSFERAATLGYDVIVIFGNPYNYVSRGFKSCKKYNVRLKNGMYPSAMMVKELQPDVLHGRKWVYHQSPVFEIDEQEAERFDEGLESLEKTYQTSQEEFYIHRHSIIRGGIMNVSEALQRRRSCRAFKQKQVDKDTIFAILNDALRTPSWCNTQPWNIWVAGGELLTEINQAFFVNKKEHVPQTSDIPRPVKWPTDANARMKEFISDLSHVAEDPAKMFAELTGKFFYAPVVIYLCMDKILSSWSMFDLGGLSQSIMLAATERGLATLPAAQLIYYPEIIRNKLEIPDNLSIVLGIAMGYEDEQHPLSKFISTRRTVVEVVKFKGIQ